MIPLLHTITLGDSLLAFFLASRIFNSYKKEKDKNLRNFFLGFLSLAIYFGSVSLPGLISDPVFVQIIYIVSYIPLYLCNFFLLLVPLNIFKFKIVYFIVFILFLSAIIIPVLNIINFSPASIRQLTDLFYYWSEGTPSWLQIIHSFVIGSAIMATAIVFFVGGMGSAEKIIRYRSILMASGFVVFLISSVSNFIFAVYFQEILYKFIATVAGGTLSFFGIGLIFMGIQYTPKKKTGWRK